MTQTKQRSAIDLDLVRQLAEVLTQSGLTEIEYAAGDCRVRVARAAAPLGPPGAALPASAAAVGGLAENAEPGEALADHPGLLASPMVGVVYTSPEPSAPAFVKPGDVVALGDTVLLIEAMKVFNPIKAHCSGRVERVFVSSGMPVEYGEPLLLIV